MISDDPQLNGEPVDEHFGARARLTSHLAARLPILLPLPSQPQPLVLDTSLRTPVSARLMKNHHMRITPKPIILCSATAAAPDRREALESAGARIEELDVEGEL